MRGRPAETETHTLKFRRCKDAHHVTLCMQKTLGFGIYFSTWEKFDTVLTGDRFALMFGGAEKTIA